jgi:putative selenium metabolism protein SsnA
MGLTVRGGSAFHGNSPQVRDGDVAIDTDDGVIVAQAGADDHVLDATGCVVLPGFVIAHHHLYSSLARGMPPGPGAPPTSFVEVLEKVWWRLDRALDAELNQLSACVGTVDALLCGVTGIVDHHASPSAIEGSLTQIANGVREAGGRAAICYEATDRHGAAGFETGLEENRRALESRQLPRTRTMVGGHAPFTLADRHLAKLAELAAEHGTYVHIHVAEAAHDQVDARARGAANVTERLAAAGILAGRSVIAHGVHLDADELAQLAEAGAWLTHQPRSNMNNHVGYLGGARSLENVALGTDGINGDIFSEAQAAFFRLREHDAQGAAESVWNWLDGGWRLLSEVFGLAPERGFGWLNPGCPADLVVLDYDSPTPVTDGTLPWHLAFGINARHVRDVIVGGEVVVRNRCPTRIDSGELRSRANAGAERLWARMSELP